MNSLEFRNKTTMLCNSTTYASSPVRVVQLCGLHNKQAVRITASVILTLLISVGILGNLLTIIVFQTVRKLKLLLVRPMVQHIAFFSIVQSSLFDTLILYKLVHGTLPELFTDGMCRLQMGAALFSYSGTLLMVSGVAFIRNCQMQGYDWFRSATATSERRVLLAAMGTVWMIALALAATWSSSDLRLQPDAYLTCTVSPADMNAAELVLEVASAILAGAIPCALTTVFYVRMYCATRNRANAGTKLGVWKSIFAIFVTNIVTVIPVCLLGFLDVRFFDQHKLAFFIPPEARVIGTLLLCTNSSANAFVYGLLCPKFREALKHFIKNRLKCCGISRSIPLNRSWSPSEPNGRFIWVEMRHRKMKAFECHFVIKRPKSLA